MFKSILRDVFNYFTHSAYQILIGIIKVHLQMIMSVSLFYNLITYKTLEWFTLTLITTPKPSLIFTFITFGTNHFYSIEKVNK